MFPGLMSRWIRPTSCASWSARAARWIARPLERGTRAIVEVREVAVHVLVCRVALAPRAHANAILLVELKGRPVDRDLLGPVRPLEEFEVVLFEAREREAKKLFLAPADSHVWSDRRPLA